MEIFAFLVLGAWCIALSISDIRSRRLPDLLTAPGAVVILIFALGTGRFAAAASGAALLTVVYLVVHLVSPAAFGAGDVKLAVGLGAAAGMSGGQAWAWAAVVAPALTAVAGLAALSVSVCADPLVSTSARRSTGSVRSATPWRRVRAPTRPIGADPVIVPHGPSMCAATLLAVAFG
ncbi:prepilin peptidase [Nocardia cyriacigeorgica]|uniref:Prepilin peptidase n=1 Tax=Nocardia cyriacigeorgica TaxID=135487 RepID=A0ABX0CG24_9NOCA|nr:A24 family peptidase [Nocardia cyriacigeorgica]NEW55508.1 prepilin peptidase [Nocardia cyriacigeorgica]